MGKSLFEIQNEQLKNGTLWNPSEQDKKAAQEAVRKAAEEAERKRQAEVAARRQREAQERARREAERRAAAQKRQEQQSAKEVKWEQEVQYPNTELLPPPPKNIEARDLYNAANGIREMPNNTGEEAKWPYNQAWLHQGPAKTILPRQNTIDVMPEGKKQMVQRMGEAFREKYPDYDPYNPTDEEKVRAQLYLQAALDQYQAEQKRIKGENYLPEGYRSATVKDALIGEFLKGYNNSQRGKELYKKMSGQKNKADDYEQMLEEDTYKYVPDKWYTKLLSGIAGFGGEEFSKVNDWKNIKYITIPAGTAFVAGQAGPQIALPEEVITVPGAAAAGLKVGMLMRGFEINAGLAYDEMVKSGVSPNVAAGLALGTSTLNTIIDVADIGELVKGYQVLDKTGVSDKVKSELGKTLLNYGIDMGVEGAVSAAQEAITIGGYNIANAAEGKALYPVGEAMDRIRDAGINSALAYGVQKLPGTIIRISYKDKKGNKTETAGKKELEFIGTIEELEKNPNAVEALGEDMYRKGAFFDLIEEGKRNNPDSLGYSLAKELEESYMGGEEVSSEKIGKLYLENWKQINAAFNEDPDAMYHQQTEGTLSNRVILPGSEGAQSRSGLKQTKKTGGSGLFSEEEVLKRIQETQRKKGKNVEKAPKVVYNEHTLFIDGEEMVTMRRVEGGDSEGKNSRERFKIAEDGSFQIPDQKSSMGISIDDEGQYAQYFADEKRPGNTSIVEFEVPKWLYDMMDEYAISQQNYNDNSANQDGLAPKMIWGNTPGVSVELPPIWTEWLQEYGQNARRIPLG